MEISPVDELVGPIKEVTTAKQLFGNGMPWLEGPRSLKVRVCAVVGHAPDNPVLRHH